MVSNRGMPNVDIIPELAYRDVRQAAAWLCTAFGFRERLLIGGHRAQLRFGDSGAIVVTQLPSEASPEGSPSHSVMVRVADIDAHHANAIAHGAKVMRPPTDYPYGERQYTAIDPGGHVWTFSQSIADVDPASWGGVLVER